jgi:hypothetical protein
MILAPLALAYITQRKAMGWHSAMFNPMIITASACCMSIAKVVAPPRPIVMPKPGTVEECQMRAWFSIATTPRPRNSLAWT